MSDISERLRLYARHFEDLHAPQNVTIAMREAADQMDQQRETTLQLLGQVGQLSDEIERLKDGEARLRAALRECEAELDDYYRNEYSGTHPYNEKKLKQAMAANPARAALEVKS